VSILKIKSVRNHISDHNNLTKTLLQSLAFQSTGDRRVGGMIETKLTSRTAILGILVQYVIL